MNIFLVFFSLLGMDIDKTFIMVFFILCSIYYAVYGLAFIIIRIYFIKDTNPHNILFSLFSRSIFFYFAALLLISIFISLDTVLVISITLLVYFPILACLIKYGRSFSYKIKPKIEKDIATDTIERYHQMLLYYMEVNKPYLYDCLTKRDLSERTSIPFHQITRIINERMKMNFTDFVNRYRVEETKKLLVYRKKQGKTILNIAFQVGFYSKSTFNIVFKKFVGLTPSRYKQYLYKKFPKIFSDN